jgi:hypothetical protein
MPIKTHFYAHFSHLLCTQKITKIAIHEWHYNADLQHFFQAQFARFLCTYFTIIVKRDVYH